MNDKTMNDIRADGGLSFEISLVKLTGRKIKDVRGYLSNEFGGVTIKLTDIVFEDDIEIGVEGEHDFPYVTVYEHGELLNMDDETLERLYAESNEDDE